MKGQRNIDFEKLIAKGEGDPTYPGGFCAQTPNGTAYWRGTGYNRQYPDYRMPQAREGGAWQPKRNNRTGE